MEDPSLLFLVLGQPVGEEAAVHAEDHDAVPLSALDPVDRRQGDAVGRRLPAQHLPQPLVKGRRVRMEGRDLLERDEVVEVARAFTATARVEEDHGSPEPDAVADRPKCGRGGAARNGLHNALHVLGEVVELLGDPLIVDLLGDSPQPGDGQPIPEPLGDPPRQAA